MRYEHLDKVDLGLDFDFDRHSLFPYRACLISWNHAGLLA
jgi:hypothetical protein